MPAERVKLAGLLFGSERTSQAPRPKSGTKRAQVSLVQFASLALQREDIKECSESDWQASQGL